MPGIDSYTKLCLHGNGADAATFIPDYGIPGVGTTPQTVLMLHFDGADAAVATKDAATDKAVTFVGTAQLDTAQSKFGGSSLLLDGDSDYVTLADSDDWNFGTGNFTIDFWVRFNDVTANTETICGQRVNAQNRWVFYFSGDDTTIFFYAEIGEVAKAHYSGTWAPSVNTWYHLALVRNGTALNIYVDGTALSLTERTAIGTKKLRI